MTTQRRLMSEEAPTEKTTPTGEAFTGTPEAEAPKSGFNLLAWINGVKPIRRAVTLYGALDLMAERDACGDDLKDARLRGDFEAEAQLKERIAELTRLMMDSRMRVVLQGVSASRYNEILEEAKKDKTVRTANDVALYQMAAQIVEPQGLGWEQLKELDDLMPTQTAKIGEAWAQINNAAPDVEATTPL